MANRFDSSDLEEAVRIMRNGGIILYPTDTIWGIGCDATNSEAVKKIYTLKQRSDSKAMLVLTDHDCKLPGLMREVPELAYDIIDMAIKPVTIIYPNARNIAPELIASDGSVGIRITKEEFSNALCNKMRVPIVSTSANISGHPSPHFFHEIEEEIKAQVDYIVKYRQDDLTPSLPSQIIKLDVNGEVKVIRE
ncbi:MAG: L-threonylcarbamoyladenylate synthase [Porphyromonadaceae bacterium]|nr:L-threonylcarbamoyladenylate synthase [Porphyromonadaceae bacterium]